LCHFFSTDVILGAAIAIELNVDIEIVMIDLKVAPATNENSVELA
jgi:hypothetical protein